MLRCCFVVEVRRGAQARAGFTIGENACRHRRHQDGNSGAYRSTAEQVPDAADIQSLREYDNSTNARELDEPACDVIQKALRHRAAMRTAGVR
jgi:hypothetical protein